MALKFRLCIPVTPSLTWHCQAYRSQLEKACLGSVSLKCNRITQNKGKISIYRVVYDKLHPPFSELQIRYGHLDCHQLYIVIGASPGSTIPQHRAQTHVHGPPSPTSNSLRACTKLCTKLCVRRLCAKLCGGSGRSSAQSSARSSTRNSA